MGLAIRLHLGDGDERFMGLDIARQPDSELDHSPHSCNEEEERSQSILTGISNTRLERHSPNLPIYRFQPKSPILWDLDI